MSDQFKTFIKFSLLAVVFIAVPIVADKFGKDPWLFIIPGIVFFLVLVSTPTLYQTRGTDTKKTYYAILVMVCVLVLLFLRFKEVVHYGGMFRGLYIEPGELTDKYFLIVAMPVLILIIIDIIKIITTRLKK